ncbi:MAG: hypothetical protein KC535_03135 [Nanoarchaeota archaeon]|nr:hypothetical protein [Nanoarchaeota archaeon]
MKKETFNKYGPQVAIGLTTITLAAVGGNTLVDVLNGTSPEGHLPGQIGSAILELGYVPYGLKMTYDNIKTSIGDIKNYFSGKGN